MEVAAARWGVTLRRRGVEVGRREVGGLLMKEGSETE